MIFAKAETPECTKSPQANYHTGVLRNVVGKKSAEVHATRPKGTVGNDKFKLSLTPAFQVNVGKCHDTPHMFASIRES